ncbi:hypothetical protein Rhopal_002210-T1 [Rhodotorula paludigena]|uniref:Uncharacterized protein n=1 Tax=Rhodotorula paludigena TaxID=86838 RepID=A0AAV5GID0_9BASI|nr:hypothetical protein Rhopal_002210-T1 [Rhodotorula paludigena]
MKPAEVASIAHPAAATGQVWEGECLEVAATCADAVKDPKNFVDAVWEVASVKVYSLG